MAFQNLYVDEFKEQYEAHANAQLLDVRTAQEIAMGAIEGAIAIDAFDAQFAAKVGQLDKSKAYFVYCRSGRRSANACQIMAQQGFSELYNLEGGYMAWEANGY
jgi:rhodanese-related sulfurtransferase